MIAAASRGVSVIIPNWNGAHHLSACLASLRAQTLKPQRVLVVDNGSTDGSLGLLEAHPEVQTLALPRNLGFAGAVNAGIRATDEPYVALLNNDTEAKPSWLEALALALEAHPEAGSAASKIMLFDRRSAFHSAGDSYGLDGIPRNRGVWQEDEGQYDSEEMVFGPCAGAALYRRSMLERIGLFEESFFAFCEDVDLAWRSQLAGYACAYAPSAIVYHKLSATGGGPTASYYTGRNTLWVIARNYPEALLREHWASVLGAQLRVAWQALKAWRGDAARARLKGQIAGARGWRRGRDTCLALRRDRTVSDDYLMSLMVPEENEP